MKMTIKGIPILVFVKDRKTYDQGVADATSSPPEEVASATALIVSFAVFDKKQNRYPIYCHLH